MFIAYHNGAMLRLRQKFISPLCFESPKFNQKHTDPTPTLHVTRFHSLENNLRGHAIIRKTERKHAGFGHILGSNGALPSRLARLLSHVSLPWTQHTQHDEVQSADPPHHQC